MCVGVCESFAYDTQQPVYWGYSRESTSNTLQLSIYQHCRHQLTCRQTGKWPAAGQGTSGVTQAAEQDTEAGRGPDLSVSAHNKPQR
jgi:hypothetical protein